MVIKKINLVETFLSKICAHDLQHWGLSGVVFNYSLEHLGAAFIWKNGHVFFLLYSKFHFFMGIIFCSSVEVFIILSPKSQYSSNFGSVLQWCLDHILSLFKIWSEKWSKKYFLIKFTLFKEMSVYITPINITLCILWNK